MADRRIAVVGGGIAGLVAAYRIATDAPDVAVTVLEASGRVGGKLWSPELDGHRVDHGADAFLARVPEAVELCRELGLGERLIEPAERQAWICVNSELHRLPEGLLLGVPTDLEALAASGLVSPAGVARAARDLDGGAEPLSDDVGVGTLIRDRLGDEVLERVVGPLLAGINAGDPDLLSVRAGAAQLAAAAADPSLIEGARDLLAAADPDRPVFHSLPGGTGELVDALVDALRAAGVDIRTGTSARTVAREGNRWRIDLDHAASAPSIADPSTTPVGAHAAFDPTAASASSAAAGSSAGVAADATAATPAADADDRLDVDGVVLAAPAPATAALLRPLAPGVADDMAGLAYASVAVVVLSWPRAGVGHALDGSGFLVAPADGMLMTACSFGSRKWPQWCDDDTVVFRASAGRSTDRRIDDLDDDQLTADIIDELTPLLGLTGAPSTSVVARWPDALPQYRPGHLERVDAWERDLATAAPGLVLAGAALRGLGIPACIASGTRAAQALLRDR